MFLLRELNFRRVTHTKLINNRLLWRAIDIYGIMGLVSFELEAKWKKQKIQLEQVAAGRHQLFGACFLTQAGSPFQAFTAIADAF